MNYLINTIEELRLQYPNINRHAEYSQFDAYVKQSTRQDLLKHIDQDTYDLITLIGQTNSKILEVKELLTTSLAYYVIYSALPFMNAVISNMGVREHSNDESTPIAQWRFKNQRWESQKVADQFIDSAIQLIIDNAALFPDFNNKKSDFFNSKTFLEHTNISGWRAYTAIIPSIRNAEDDLEKILCEHYDDFNTLQSSVDPIDVKLISIIRKYIAHNALAKAIPRLLLYIDADGIKITSSNDGFDFKANVLSSFGTDGPEKLIKVLNLDIKEAQQDILNYLYKNKTRFVTWYDSLPKANMDSNYITYSPDKIGGIGLF
jgi:hypothetical protein